MANRRMFSKDVVGTDSFLDMPISAQALFFHLGMEGDDDGFVKNPKTVMRTIGAKPDDLNVLSAKGFIIPFQTGIIAIRHWRILNTLKNDRYHPTTCLQEKQTLQLSDGIWNQVGTKLEPSWNQTGTMLEPEHNITEHNRTKHNREEKKTPTRHKYGQCENVLLSDTEYDTLKEEFPDIDKRIERLSAYIAQSGKSYKSHMATIRNWARRDAEEKKQSYQQHSYNADDFGDSFFFDPTQ